jgi:DNA repair exonuclease SbcCD nuclease subunit
VADAVNIGLLHTSLDGARGHDSYAPCTVAELRGMDYQYWALGHVHQRRVIADGGPCTIVMPGNPQGRDVSESGARSASLVTIRPDLSMQVQERLTSLVQFERVPVDLSAVDDWAELVTRITKALEQARRAVPSDHLVARLHLTGATPLAWRIRKHLDVLTTEARERARVIGGCWVEQLEAATTALPAAVKDSNSPLVELKRLIDQDVLHSNDFRAQLAAVCNELRRTLPPECSHLLDPDQADFKDQMARLSRDGVEDILSHLHTDTHTDTMEPADAS